MKSTVSASTRTLVGKKSGIQIQLAVRAATVICALLCATEVSAQPTVPGFTVQMYASDLYRIERISLDSSGVLYAGTDHRADPSRIYRVGVGGFPVEEFGPALWDPDAVFVDVAGDISGIPGSVLVGGIHEQWSGQGYIGAILPDESFQFVHGPTAEFINPQEFAMDSTGRLLFVDYVRNSVYWSDGVNFGLLFSLPARPVHIAVDSADRIFTYTYDETIRIHDIDGNYMDDLATGLTPRAVDSAMATGPGGVWGTDLYVINGGALLRFVADPGSPSFGETTILGTGFDIYYPDMVFGPDGGLYVSVGSGDQHDILRILPDCNNNDIPDEQDIVDCDGSPWCSDCNGNGIPDECDIAPADPDGNGEVSPDDNGDGVPDECVPQAPIPTVTAWGLILMTLLLLTLAKIHFGRRRVARETA